jgi:HEAT repeat protein
MQLEHNAMPAAIMCVAIAVVQVVCDDSPCIAALAKSLRATDSRTRYLAADRLCDLGPKAAEAVQALIVALDDEDEAVRRKAAEALGAIGVSAIPPLLKVVESKDRSVESRSWAIWSLGTISVKDKRVEQALIAALRDQNADIRRDAASSLGDLKVYRAVPYLIKVLEHDEDDFVRLSAIATILVFGPEAKDAAPALVRVLKSPGGGSYAPVVAGEAAKALVFLGRDGLLALAGIIKDRSAAINARVLAMWALTGATGGKAAETPGGPEICVPILLAVLIEHDGELRPQAVDTLGYFGAKAKAAIPALIKVVDRGSPDERIGAAHSLLRIDPENWNFMPVLLAGLQDKNKKVRDYATIVVGELGPKGKAAVPMLRKNLNTEDVKLCIASVNALGDIGPTAQSAVPALRELLRSENRAVRDAAAQALKRIEAPPDELPRRN